MSHSKNAAATCAFAVHTNENWAPTPRRPVTLRVIEAGNVSEVSTRLRSNPATGSSLSAVPRGTGVQRHTGPVVDTDFWDQRHR
jgi:hypothetical protein